MAPSVYPERAQRFWSRVDKNGPMWNGSACWLWRGPHTANGYGRFAYSDAGKQIKVYAHRYAYTLTNGPIPEGLDLDHRCRRRHCVNPAHLEPVTRAENLRRGAGPGGALRPRRRCLNCGAHRKAMAINGLCYRCNLYQLRTGSPRPT